MDLPWEQKENFLSDYMGTSSLNQAMVRYNGMLKADIEGTHPLYRDKNWDRQNRSKKCKKTSWASDCDGVIFVESTPGGQLAKMYQKEVKEFPGKVKFKIVEKRGKNFKSILQKSNPKRVKGCDAEDCFACSGGRGEGWDCRNRV